MKQHCVQVSWIMFFSKQAKKKFCAADSGTSKMWHKEFNVVLIQKKVSGIPVEGWEFFFFL